MSDYRSIGFERWGRTCAFCDGEVGLEVHHIDGNRANNAAENLMPLCGTCHNVVTLEWVHVDPATRQPEVLVNGIFEAGPRTPPPPQSVQIQVAALRSIVPRVWELDVRHYGLVLLHDGVSDAYYTYCHVPAGDLVDRLDFDTVLDPSGDDDDPENEPYRFNRGLRDTSDVFERMVEDAKGGRPFADIIVEWNTTYRADQPLKVLGGQHRGEALKRAVEAGADPDRLHGVRIYFSLGSAQQRVELVLIANSNIAIPNQLLDRIAEQQMGGQSRAWCQRVGLLGPGEDFTDRVAGDNRVTVQFMRAFVTNYWRGRAFTGDLAADHLRDVYIPATGRFDPDETYAQLIKERPEIWNDGAFEEAGREFARLNAEQILACEQSTDGELRKVAFRYKALQPTLAAGWAFIAGALHDESHALPLLYRLPDNYDRRTSRDPLNALGMSRFRLPSDPSYRGLGTRQNPSEGQKIAELFRLISDSNHDNHITNNVIRLAVTTFQAKEFAQMREDEERKAKRIRGQISPD